MSSDLRPISLHNLGDAIHLINESSRGMSFEYNLDTFGFLSLARYWRFSYEHSLVRYVEGEPAAVFIVCADPATREAWGFYWGALRKFWRQQVALPLFEACCNRLRADGYTVLYGGGAPERPARRYRFVHAQPQQTFVQMEATTPTLPPEDARFQIRKIYLGNLSASDLCAGESLYWCHQHNFLRHSAQSLLCIGAFSTEVLKAYAVIFPRDQSTEILDLRSREGSIGAGSELVRWLLSQNYPSPFRANAVLQPSYAECLFATIGFQVTKQWALLSRDLRTTCSATSRVG